MRETRTQLREKHKSRLQEEYLEKAAIVKQVIHDSIYREGEATGAIPYGGSPPRSPKGLPSPSARSPESPKPPSPTAARTSPSQRRVSRDNFEPPSCDLCLSWLAGRKYRSTLDCRWGFYQVGLTERARRVLTLNTSLGTFCFNRLVMGHLNATAEFQRHVNFTLGDSLWREALAMVDDVIVANETLPEHITSLRRVLGKLAQRHHSIKPSKMHILRDQVDYLGHVSTPEVALRRRQFCSSSPTTD